MKKKIGEIYNKPIVIGDKNLVTKNETHISELQESNEGFQYKSNKTCWYLDPDKITAENFDSIKNIIMIIATSCPIYSSIRLSWDGAGFDEQSKFYATYSLGPLIDYCTSTKHNWHTIYFEEAECGIINLKGYNVKPTVMNIFAMFGENISEEELYEMCGLKKIPYEEYMAVNINLIIGKELVNE